MPSEFEPLIMRVAKLESENRLLKGAGLAVTLGALVLASLSASKAPRTIEAEKFVLLDREGRARVTIGTSRYSGAAVETGPDDPVIWLSDSKGTDRAILSVDALRFSNANGRRAINLEANPGARAPEMRLYTPDGEIIWSTP